MNDSKLGWLFGFTLLAGLYILAGLFGLKHVEEATSYGLKEILACLKDLIIFWAGWKFKDAMTNKPGG